MAYIVFFSHTVPLQLGYLAVLLFFMLSGFWVYQMWEKEYINTTDPVPIFLVSRFWRILPIYYVTLVIYVAVSGLFSLHNFPIMSNASWDTFHVYFSHIFILGYALLPESQRVFGVVWSLDIELQFYLVAPFVIKLVKSKRFPRISVLTLWSVALIGLFCQIKFYHLESTRAFLPMYFWAFLTGIYVAHTDWKPTIVFANLLAYLGVLFVIVCMIIPSTRPLICMGSFSGWLSEYNENTNLVLSIIVMPYAMLTVRQSPRPGSRFIQLDRDLSNITYEIYLLHFCFIPVIEYTIGSDSKFHHIYLIIGAWIAVFPLAYIVYFVIDRPIDRKRRAFVRGRRALLAVWQT